MNDGSEKSSETKNRLGLWVAAIGVAVAGAGWWLADGSRAPDPAPQAQAIPSRSEPAPQPERAAPGANVAQTGSIQLVQGVALRIAPGSLVPDNPLTVALALPPSASDIGIEATWLYADNHDPTQIQAQRTGPLEVGIEYPAELLTPGRHIIELRTDERDPIPLRRFSFEIQ